MRLRRWHAWRESRIWANHRLDGGTWRQTVQTIALLQQRTATELHQLHRLVSLFLHDKRFEPVHGLMLSDLQRATIAAFACLPILNLGYGWLQGWRSVVVYPDAFRVQTQQQDEAGVVHEWTDLRAGESWETDGIVLSWHDIEADLQPGCCWNLVIHEIAHKLDMRDGTANGCPPLHPKMNPQRWQQVCRDAFDRLAALEASGVELPIDPYALESPAEFFAVVSEYFFTAPEVLREPFPELFGELERFYGGDGAA